MNNKHIYLSKKVEKFATMLPGFDIRDLRALAAECNEHIDAAIGEVRKGPNESFSSASNGSIQSAASNATTD